MTNFDKYIFAQTCKKIHRIVNLNLGAFYAAFSEFRNGSIIASNGYESLFEWFHDLNLGKPQTLTYNFAINGHFNLLKKAVSWGYPVYAFDTIHMSFNYGHFDITHWLLNEINVPINNVELLVRYATTETKKQALKTLLAKTKTTPDDNHDICLNFYKYNMTEMIRWFDTLHPGSFYQPRDTLIGSDKAKMEKVMSLYCMTGNVLAMQKLNTELKLDIPGFALKRFVALRNEWTNHLKEEDYLNHFEFLYLNPNVDTNNILRTIIEAGDSTALMWLIKKSYNEESNAHDQDLYSEVKDKIQDIFENALHFLEIVHIKYFTSVCGCILNSQKIATKEIFQVTKVEILEYLHKNGVIPQYNPNVFSHVYGEHVKLTLFLDMHLVLSTKKLDYGVVNYWIEVFKSDVCPITLEGLMVKEWSFNAKFSKEKKTQFYKWADIMNPNKQVRRAAEGCGFFFLAKYLIKKGELAPKKIRTAIPCKFDLRSVNYMRFLLSRGIQWDPGMPQCGIWMHQLFSEPPQEIFYSNYLDTIQTVIFLMENHCPYPDKFDQKIKALLDINKDRLCYKKSFWESL